MCQGCRHVPVKLAIGSGMSRLNWSRVQACPGYVGHGSIHVPVKMSSLGRHLQERENLMHERFDLDAMLADPKP